MDPNTVHPVDEKLPFCRLAALGLQHVVVMYAGAIAVPLIVGRALKLSPDQVALLIWADLFACGIVTLLQFVAPRWTRQMAHSLHPLLESGILFTAVSAVLLNLFFNGTRADVAGAIAAAKVADAH
jgi:xanthine/uracil permease